jgi:thiol-disulfide isomerase/thioredoxin
MSDQIAARLAACGLAALALTVCTVTGCTDNSPAPGTSTPARGIDVTAVDRAEYDATIANLKGSVVLVDCWAKWCLPCVEQLPHSVEVARQNGRAGLTVVTLSFDDADMLEKVANTLADAGAGFGGVTNLQSKLGASSDSMKTFEIASGALPAYKLYDRQGKLRQTFELDPSAARQFTPADIDAAVVELLAE